MAGTESKSPEYKSDDYLYDLARVLLSRYGEVKTDPNIKTIPGGGLVAPADLQHKLQPATYLQTPKTTIMFCDGKGSKPTPLTISVKEAVRRASDYQDYAVDRKSIEILSYVRRGKGYEEHLFAHIGRDGGDGSAYINHAYSSYKNLGSTTTASKILTQLSRELQLKKSA